MAEKPLNQIEKALQACKPIDTQKVSDLLGAQLKAQHHLRPEVLEAMARIARPSIDVSRVVAAMKPIQWEPIGEQIKALTQVPSFADSFPKAMALQMANKPLIDPDLVSQFAKQQFAFDQIFKNTELSEAIAAWQQSLPTNFTDQVLGYDDAVEEADAKEVLEDLAERRQAVLKVLEETIQTLAALKLLGVDVIPDIVLGLLMLFVLYGDKAESIIGRASGDD